MAMNPAVGSPWTVLIVDDEPQILRLLVRVFERAGYRVLAADNGDAAIDQFVAHADEIDLLFLDVGIPPAGADAVLDRVLPEKPDFCLVLASGDELEPTLQARIDAHGGHFVRKPFLPRALLDRLRGWMGVRPREEPPQDATQ